MIRSTLLVHYTGCMGPGIRPRRALVRVGYDCNNRCAFCHTLREPRDRLSDADVVQRIDRARELAHTGVVVSGGEPTIRRGLVGWARRCHEVGLGFGVITNGRMLSYRELSERLLKLGLDYAHVSLHGGCAPVHDGLVRATAFHETLGAIEFLADRGVAVTVNCVVTSENLHGLDALVDLLLHLPVELKLAFPDPKGGADERFAELVPEVAVAAQMAHRAIERGRSSGGRMTFAHEGLPLCLMPGQEGLTTDLHRHGFISTADVGDADFVPIDLGHRSHPAPCDDCSLRGACPGLHREYVARRGYAPLTRVLAPRSNSFTLEAVRTLPWPRGAPCPVLADGARAHDLHRTVYLRRETELAQYETRTSDFNHAELASALCERRQLYVDRGGKAAPDDFAIDLGAVADAPECTRCPARTRCPGAVQETLDERFSTDFAQLEAILAELRGHVLDVGAGSGRYLGALAPAAREGTLSYLGVDPDAAALESLQARHAWAQTRVGTAETLPSNERWDHVLMINSYNHLRDPHAVIAALCARLRPGGSLLVADDVAFGLLRTAPQKMRAETSNARFEHYRNHDARSARSTLADLPLELLTDREVSRESSNMWWVHYRRRAG